MNGDGTVVGLASSAARSALRLAVRTVVRAVPPVDNPALDGGLRRVASVFRVARQHTLPVARLRTAYRLDSEVWQGPVPDGVRTTDELLELPADPSGPRRQVRARTYVPAHPTGGGLVYVHGGGFAIGSIATHDATCRRLAAGAGVEVTSVEYRLAPEHPFPAGLTDVLQAWTVLHERWVAAGRDPRRLGIGGDSAGGHAAATTADEAVAPTLGVEVPAPGFCWLVYPGTETVASGPALRTVLRRGGLLSGAMVARFTEWHVGDGDVTAPALNPGLRPDEVLAGHPPTWIQTVEHDPLLPQGRRYARRLADAGVEVVHEHEPTMAHGYVSMTGVSPGAAAATGRSVAGLRRLVDRASADA